MNDELFWRLKGNKRCERCGASVPKNKLEDGICLSCSNPRCFFCNYWKNLKFVQIAGMGCKAWVCSWCKKKDDVDSDKLSLTSTKTSDDIEVVL